jgi:hypothetical protein
MWLGSGTVLQKPTGGILPQLFMAILSFNEEKAHSTSLCKMELPSIHRRIPSRIYKKEEPRLFLGLLFLLT